MSLALFVIFKRHSVNWNRLSQNILIPVLVASGWKETRQVGLSTHDGPIKICALNINLEWEKRIVDSYSIQSASICTDEPC